MEFEGDKDRTIYAMMVARMWRDPNFKQSFISDPRAALTQEGIDLPGDVTVKVLEDTPSVKYVNLPRDIGGQAREGAGALMEKLLPIPEGRELRFVQSTEKTRYVVVPTPPPGVEPTQSSESELMEMTADSGVEATYHDTSQSVEAETTEVTVTETSEVQDAETSTTVVAEAELVAT